MNSRTNYASGSPWEDLVGYSRAVKIGNTIEVTGTVADHEGELQGGDDPYLQTKHVLLKIQETLQRAGAEMSDVVRTRMFVTNIADWEAIGRAHQEFFGEIKPCTTMVEVASLIDDRYLVEIEATAILQE